MLYFAYGSNMNPQRAAKRMPDARAVGIGILHGWRLVERLYADIEPADGQSVIGVLYQVSGNDLVRLDRCEGYPHIYCRKTVTVDCGDFKVIAQTYHMNAATRRERNGIPYPEHYRKICSAGADVHHIPNQYRRKLKMRKGNIYVAVYGTLMTGERNYRFGAGAVRRIPCFITGALYDTGYGYPAFSPDGVSAIRAELLEVSPAVLAQMDTLEGYPRLYRRETIAVRTSAGTVEAQIYVMNRLPENAVPIISGDWPEYRKESSQYLQ